MIDYCFEAGLLTFFSYNTVILRGPPLTNEFSYNIAPNSYRYYSWLIDLAGLSPLS